MDIVCSHNVEGLITNLFTELYTKFKEGFLIVECGQDIKIKSDDGSIIKDHNNFFNHNQISGKLTLFISCIDNIVIPSHNEVGKVFKTLVGEHISPIALSKWYDTMTFNLYNHSIVSIDSQLFIQQDSFNCCIKREEEPIGPRVTHHTLNDGENTISQWINLSKCGIKTIFLGDVKSVVYHTSEMTVYVSNCSEYTITLPNSITVKGHLKIKMQSSHKISVNNDIEVHSIVEGVVWVTLKGEFGYINNKGFNGLNITYKHFDVCDDKILCHRISSNKVDIYSGECKLVETIVKDKSHIHTCGKYFINVGNGKCDIYHSDLRLVHSFAYKKSLWYNSIFQPMYLNGVFYLTHIYGDNNRFTMTTYTQPNI